MSDEQPSARPTEGDGQPPNGSVPGVAPMSGPSDRTHWRRLAILWLAEMIVMNPIIYFLIWKHLPPGAMTSAANGARFDTLVLTMLANGALAAVLVYFGYALVNWREPKGEPLADGPPLRSHFRVQASWIVVTAGIVLGAFVFGTYELIVPAGAGSGGGPDPIWTPTSKHVLPVQVIGQQWYWTYRYPTFGGFETTQLLLPNHTTIAFHVTSLDVVHDWWAYQLGIKADANPGVDNVAFADTYQTGRFVVRCDELCGIWHGAMYNFGHVVSKSSFEQWGKSEETKLASLTALLPKFSWTYFPSANSADGGYYPSGDPFYQYFKYLNGESGKSGPLPAVHVPSSNTPASKGTVEGGATAFERAHPGTEEKKPHTEKPSTAVVPPSSTKTTTTAGRHA